MSNLSFRSLTIGLMFAIGATLAGCGGGVSSFPLNGNTHGEVPVVNPPAVTPPVVTPPVVMPPVADSRIIIKLSAAAKASAAAVGISTPEFNGHVDDGPWLSKPVIDELPLGTFSVGAHHLEGTIYGAVGGKTYLVRNINRTITTIKGQDLVVTIE